MTSPSNDTWVREEGDYSIYVSESTDDKYAFDTYKVKNRTTSVVEMETSSLVGAVQFARSSTHALSLFDTNKDLTDGEFYFLGDSDGNSLN